jgi:tetratricopeptide (TPR) repeat protein
MNWLRLVCLLSVVCLAAGRPVLAAPYSVDGFTLGQAVTKSNLQSFSCSQSEQFESLASCQRTQTRNRGYDYSAFSTVLQDENGIAVLLKVKVAPVRMTKSEAQKEIEQLSKELGGKPSSVDWVDPRGDGPASVVARWGEINLSEIDTESSAAIDAGKDPGVGFLIETLGDSRRSSKLGLQVYRISGGAGYIYTASFDKSGRGHREYVAADGDQLVVRRYMTALRALLAHDKSTSTENFELWPKVADLTRSLARDTSPQVANDALDKAFENIPSKKYRSHVWAFLPGGAIQHLEIRQHWDVDIYGPKTEHPEIRNNILTFLAANPPDPFTEFLYYVVGDYERALRVTPRSPVNDVLHYARGFRALGPVLHDAIQTVKTQAKSTLDEPDEIFRKINFLLDNQDLFDNKPLSTLMPDFAARVAPVRAELEEVLRDPKAPHADDAAFILGWLTMHEGKSKEEALPYFSKAMVVGNGDYKDPGAMGRVLRILEKLPSNQQIALVDGDTAFSRQPALAYVAARSAYREFDYAVTIDAATRYLKGMGINPDSLPVTTDPERIGKALEKSDDKYVSRNLLEIPYILQASKEIARYETSLRDISSEKPDTFIKRSRTIIKKYSKLLDSDDNQGKEDKDKKKGIPDFAHKDLRQAIHLIDMTLAQTKDAPYAHFREWLYYRKVRVAAAFAPDSVPQIVATMSAEFPTSRLLDDVLAEQLYAQGFVQRDLDAARQTFRTLVDRYSNSNAIDNAYSWMAIILRCKGQFDEAQKLNREIIRRFPLTRHAGYAKERLADPKTCGVESFSEEQ